MTGLSEPGEREETSYEPVTIQPWLEADPKIAEWYHSTAKKAKGTALNYSRLLYLYWQDNKRFRSFKTTGQAKSCQVQYP